MQVWADHSTFPVFVAGAVYAVNASTVIGFCTAWLFLWRNRTLRLEKVLVPTVVASAVGVVAGVFLLHWLAGTAYQLLRLLLGASIVGCALSLWLQEQGAHRGLRADGRGGAEGDARHGADRHPCRPAVGRPRDDRPPLPRAPVWRRCDRSGRAAADAIER
jgi:uncharacterized membrane protein YfcA